MLPLAALAGGFVGGPLLEVLGRKTTIMTTALPFMGAGKSLEYSTHFANFLCKWNQEGLIIFIELIMRAKLRKKFRRKISHRKVFLVFLPFLTNEVKICMKLDLYKIPIFQEFT